MEASLLSHPGLTGLSHSPAGLLVTAAQEQHPAWTSAHLVRTTDKAGLTPDSIALHPGRRHTGHLSRDDRTTLLS